MNPTRHIAALSLVCLVAAGMLLVPDVAEAGKKGKKGKTPVEAPAADSDTPVKEAAPVKEAPPAADERPESAEPAPEDLTEGDTDKPEAEATERPADAEAAPETIEDGAAPKE